MASANPPITYSAMLLSAYRGQEQAASRLIDAARGEAVSAGEGRIATVADYAGSVLHNGLGRHDLALAAARRVFERDVVGWLPGHGRRSSLRRPRSRMHDAALLSHARSRSSERATVTGTDWALGIQARIEALANDGPAAEGQYAESIERLGKGRPEGGSRPRAPPVRRVAATRWTAGRRAGRAAYRLRPAVRHGTRRVRGARANRAAGDGREGPQANRRHRATTSRHRSSRSPGWRATACRTRRSARGCSSALEPSSGTCARSSRRWT